MEDAKKDYLRLVIVVLVLLFILGGFALYVSFPLLSSKTIILDTQPVDPFDPVRGQYMVIGYEIESIDSIKSAEIGDKIYVVLTEDENGISRYENASLEKPSNDKVFIKGEINYIDEERMRVEYGIEQYFFERNAKFETRIDFVEVKLSDFGGARILELLDENKNPVKITYPEKTLRS